MTRLTLFLLAVFPATNCVFCSPPPPETDPRYSLIVERGQLSINGVPLELGGALSKWTEVLGAPETYHNPDYGPWSPGHGPGSGSTVCWTDFGICTSSDAEGWMSEGISVYLAPSEFLNLGIGAPVFKLDGFPGKVVFEGAHIYDGVPFEDIYLALPPDAPRLEAPRFLGGNNYRFRPNGKGPWLGAALNYDDFRTTDTRGRTELRLYLSHGDDE